MLRKGPQLLDFLCAPSGDPAPDGHVALTRPLVNACGQPHAEGPGRKPAGAFTLVPHSPPTNSAGEALQAPLARCGHWGREKWAAGGLMCRPGSSESCPCLLTLRPHRRGSQGLWEQRSGTLPKGMSYKKGQSPEGDKLQGGVSYGRGHSPTHPRTQICYHPFYQCWEMIFKDVVVGPQAQSPGIYFQKLLVLTQALRRSWVGVERGILGLRLRAEGAISL